MRPLSSVQPRLLEPLQQVEKARGVLEGDGGKGEDGAELVGGGGAGRVAKGTGEAGETRGIGEGVGQDWILEEDNVSPTTPE